MARNRKVMNNALFKAISARLGMFSPDLAFDPAERFVSLNGDQREQQFAAKAKEIVSYDGLTFHATLVDAEEAKRTWLLCGIPFSPTLNPDVQKASPGELLYYYYTHKFNLIVDPRTCYDISSFLPDDYYEGHDPDQLFGCFTPIYRIDEKDPSVCRSRQLNCAIVDKSNISNNIDDDIRCFINSSDYVNCTYEIVKLKSCYGYGYRRGFIDAYNGIESLFFRVYIRDVYDFSQPKIPEIDFYEIVETKIGWRPREIDCLRKIFEILRDHNHEAFEKVCKLIEVVSDQSNDAAKTVAEKLYKFRNSVVHWRGRVPESFSSENLRKHTLACLTVLNALPSNLFDTQQTCTCSGRIELY